MAGFVGVCSNNLTLPQEALTNVVNATVYSSNTAVKEVFSGNNLILQKSFVSFLETQRMHAQNDTVQVWIDGEIYNQSDLSSQPEDAFADTMLNHYLNNTLESLLKKVDGIFIALIYDRQKCQLQVITDRYGLKPFYLSVMNNCLMLAPELKCFPLMKPFSLNIRADVVDCFIKLEHMMDNVTWFKDVEVTAPSTIYTYAWGNNTITKSRYWSWSFIKRSSLSLNEAAEELAFLLDTAIKKRSGGNCRVGIGLSGGFDSRAILAAVQDLKPPTYTFGIEESADVKIANRVAKVAGVSNVHFDMRVNNWLQKRFSGVWKTDGMLNMYHMHYSHLMDEIPKIMDVNLSGFLGDGVLGSTYLTKKGKTFLNKRIDHATAQHCYGEYHKFSDPSDSFFDIPKIDAYLFYNRGRRLTGLGMEEANKTIYQRLPFMDNDLMDFSYSLPDEYRKNSRMYYRALLFKYPEYYRNIPHATSGVPISINPSLIYKSKKMYHRWLWIVKYKLGIATSFTDVYNWVKEPETSNVIRQILNTKTALYPNFTNNNFVMQYLEPHVQGKGNHAKQIMGALTMEIWLQQIVNKKYVSSFIKNQ